MRIGIDLGGSKIEGIILDEAGAELDRKRMATPVGYEAIIHSLIDLVDALKKTAGQEVTIGIGIPGAISPATGLIKNANTTCLIGKPFGQDLCAALGQNIRMANDANCFTKSEAIDGAGKGARVVFGVIMGTGCGGGLVIDGKVITGPHAIAGEWGHNPLPWAKENERPGPDCYCGKQGCLETWISGPGLAADHYKRTAEHLTALDLVAEAAAGGAAAQESLNLFFDRLSRGLSTVINVLDPDVIVLGGGLSNIDAIYQEMPKRLGQYVFSDEVSTPIVKNVHGDSSGVRGAAWLWPQS